MQVKALVFDTFGTVVDWRGSIIAEGQAWRAGKGDARHSAIDWARFADRWRDGYGPAMEKVRKGDLPWTKLDDLHRMLLNDLVREFNMNGLSEAEIDHWNKVWHRLKPWPDASRGLKRLKRRYVIATLSNGNTRLLIDLAKNGDLPWDSVFSSETFHHYKPDPEMYLGAAEVLDVKPSEVMMVASHKHDLRSAAKYGLKTAFIKRPHEYGRNNNPDLASEAEFTANAESFLDLADQLGV